MKQSLHPTPSILRVLVACLLAFTILIMPIAAVAAPSIARATLSTKTHRTDKTSRTDKAKSADEELFVNPPTALTAPALPGPKPEPAPEPLAPFLPGPVTATMTAALTPTANNGNGQADPGDTINYTAILTNTGSDPTGLMSLNDFMDSHTTFVPGSIQSTPVCFDQSVSTNEDVAKAITLTGEDPDGDGITFSIVSGPSNGSLDPGVAGASQTYTPAANFFGADSFTFRVNDGTTSGAGANGNSNETCTVSITVNPVNDAPTFTVPGNPAAVNEDAGAQSVPTFISPASVRPAPAGVTNEDAQTVSFVITNNTNPGLFSTPPAINVVGGSYPKTATLTYTSATNQNGTAVITYHAHDDGGTSPGVDNSADQTFTITVNAVNDPPVVVAPAAFPVQANMKRTGLTGLLGNVNDNADNGVNGCTSTTFTVTSGSISATSPAGGVVSNVNLSAGTFDFEPPPGFTGGNATFTYTVSDTGCPGVGISAPVTVTVAVSGPVIWFVNPAAGVNGTGTLNSPFNVLASANTAMGLNAGQRIFVYTGTTTSGVGVTLTTSQWLIGQGATDSSNTTNFDTFMGISPPANTIARPLVNQTKPTIQGRVQMNASSTRVQGINITPPAGTQALTGTSGAAMTGMQVGVSASQSDVTVTTTGQNGTNAMGVSLNNAGGVFSLISVNVNQDGVPNRPAGAIALTNLTGSFTVLGTGTTAGTGGTIQNVRGGDAIALNNTDGLVTLKNMIIQDITAANDATDANGTRSGVDAISGVNVDAGLTLENTTIRRISDNAILGGTNGVPDVSTVWNGLTINNCTIEDTNRFNVSHHGDATSEGTVRILGIRGTVNVTNSLFQRGAEFLDFTVTSGTLTMTVTNSDFTSAYKEFVDADASPQASVGLHGIDVTVQGSSNAAVTIGDRNNAALACEFLNNRLASVRVANDVGATGNIDVTMGRNLFKSNDHSSGRRCNPGCSTADFDFPMAGVLVMSRGADTATFDVIVDRNTFDEATNASGGVGQLTLDMSRGVWQVLAINNTFDTPGNAPWFMRAELNATTAKVKFKDNIGVGGFFTCPDASCGGGYTAPGLRALADVQNGGKLDLTIDNDTFAEHDAGFDPGQTFEGRALNVGAANTLCMDLRNNNAPDGYGLEQFNASQTVKIFTAGGSGTCTGGAPANCQTALNANGNQGGSNNPNTVPPFVAAFGTVNIVAVACQAPSLAMFKGESPQREYLAQTDKVFQYGSARSPLSFFNTKDDFASIFVDFNPGTQSAPTVVTASQTLSSQIIAGVEGIRGKTEARSQKSEVRKQETGNREPETAQRGQDARVASQSGEADRGSSPRVSKGVNKSEVRSQRSEVRDQRSGVRSNHSKSVKTVRVQGSGVRSSRAAAHPAFAPAPLSGGTFPINGTGPGFILPAGKSTTIKFSVTLNNPPNLAGPISPQVQNHGTLSGAFSNNPIDTNTVTTVVDLFDSTTTLASVPPAPSTGQAVTYTATVVASTLPNPTAVGGTVTFKDTGVDIPGCVNKPVSSGTATCNVAAIATGSHSVVAHYSGDGNFDPGASSALLQTVNQSSTSTSVTSSLNPSLVTQNVTFTATVTSGTALPITGTVTFKDGAATITCDSGQALTAGVATCVTNDLIAGNHNITAVYGGDTNFTTSTGTLTGDPQVVNKSGTTTSLVSSLNPSSPTRTVTYTATVASATVVTGPFTGTVTFKDGVTPIVCEAGSQALTGAGVATCKFTYPDTVGSPHSITAEYGGDSTFDGSTSTPAISQVVSQKATTTALTSSANPSAPTVTVTYTATVASADIAEPGPPTGTVTFKDGVTTIVCENVGGQTLNGSGVATCQFTYPDTVGSPHSITAVYNGDAIFLSSTSTPALSQVVSSCSASVVVTSAADDGSAGTLRKAIDTGVCTGGTITFDTAGVFATPQTITLTIGELSIARNLTIDGPDAAGNRVTVSGGGASRVFKLQPTFTATIRDLTITGGLASGVSPANLGGGLYNDHGTLTLTNMTISGNTATGTGGGVYNNGIGGSATVNINNSTLSGNSADNGGAICNEADATFSATLNITNSTISGNRANANGGGLYNLDAGAVATLTSVTITGNVTDNDNNASGTGGGINVAAGTVTLKNTIVAGNVLGGPQVETATVAETTPGTLTAGDAKVIVTAAGMTGSPKTVNVPVATNDTEATVASKIRAGLAADTDVNAFFIVSGSGTAVVLTARTSAANDTSMNIDISDGTSVGLTAAPASADTTPGVVPTAHDIAGTIAAASTYNLIGDAGSSGGLTDSGGVGNRNIVGVGGAGTIVTSTILNTTLADNGGPTRTHALVNGSPALEKGNAFSLTTDQRGFARPVNFDSIAPVAPYDDTDIGAYELQVTPGTPNAPDLDAASDTGVSSTDNLTSDTSPTFTITGVTLGATVELLRDVSPGTGTQQVETATVVGAIPGSNQVETLTVTTPGDLPLTLGGDASVTVTAVGMTNSPKTILVAVAALDDAAAVAGKIRAAFTADANIGHVTTGFFTVSGTDANVVLTAKVKALNDGTMNVSIDSCTCTGLTAVPSSANTTPGAASGAGNATVTVTAAGMNNSPKTLNVAVVDGDTASIVAGKMRTALSSDPDVSAMFTVSGATDKIVLTAITAAANDATLNIATANGTSTGLTPQPTSADTTAGAAGPVVVASGIAAGTSIQLTDPSVAASTTPYLYTARQTVSGAPRSPQSASLSVTIDNTTPAAPDAPDLIAASDTGSSSTDNLTNDTTPTFDIGNVTSGNTVNLLRDTNPTSGPPVVVATGVAAGSSIQLTDPSAPAGSYSYTSRQTNGIGNSTSSTTALIVNIDTTPPPAPGTPDLQAGSDSFAGGGTNSDNITNAAALSFDVAGTTVGATVQLLRDGVVVASTAGTGGIVVLTDSPSPSDNVYAYTARQVDGAGNFATSAALNVTIDKIGTAAGIPDLRATSDSFGPSGTNSDDITNVVARSFDIAGTESGSLVELYRGAALIASTTGTGGTVTLVDNSLLADGPYAYTSRQTDIVGNVAASTELFVTIDMTPNAPGVPDLQAASDTGTLDTDNITGNATHSFDISAQIGAFVELLRDGVVVASTTATLASVTLSDSASLPDAVYHYSARQTDKAGNIATSADLDVTIDGTNPSVAMTSGVGNPTATTPIPVTVTFSQPVSGFTSSDIVPGNGTVGNFLGGPTIYTFDLTPTSPGAVSADIAAGVATDTAGNTNTAATQFNRTFDPSALNATITPVAPDPRNASVSSIQIVFNKAIQPADFTLADLSLKLGAPELLPGAATLTTLDNTIWTLGNLTGLTGAEGTYVLKLTAAGSGIKDTANNLLTADATETWVMDTTAPDVTINQAAGQTDPVTGTTAGTVINFTAIFTEPVVLGSFTNTDITISGTAGATVVNISQIAPNDGTTFNVAIEGMTQSGTVIADIPAGAVQDAAGNGNTVGTFTDHTVTFNKDDFTTLEVNTTDDSDDGACTPLGGGGADCTLREAILAANADAGAETITFNSVVFAAPGPYTINLTGALPDLSTDMTISGPGAKVLTVKRNTGGDYRIFFIPSGNVTIDGLTMSNGHGGLNAGGGINNLSSGTVNVTNSTISGNSAITGGGIATIGTTLNVSNTTISGNSSPSGGGIYAGLGTVNITNSTISGNAAASDGGGVLSGATLLISNSTIAFNRADNDNNASGTGGGIFRSSGTVTLRNTIVGQNFNDASPSITADDISGAVNSEGFNLIQSTLGATITETLNAGTNITTFDPQLFPLADNGGPTFTHALQCTSPAIDKGKAFTLTTDQRGGVRPFDLADAIYPNAAGGDGSDIGAYETQTGGGCQPVAVPPAPQPSTNEDTPVVITLTGTYSQNFALTFAITQAPANGSLGSISAPVCVFTLSMTCTSTVTYTPSANSNGLDSFKFKTSASGLDSDEADVNITVVSVNDAPVANGDLLSNIAEDSGVRTIPFTDLTGSDSPGPANEAGQALTVISVSSPVGGTVSILGTDVLFTPTANYHGPASFQYKIRDNGTTNGLPDPKDSVLAATVTFDIDPVADTPSVTNATTDEDTQTTSGLVISRNPADGAEVTHFKITGITNGTLFQNDGATPIANNQFITFAEGNAGLRFTPDANLFSPTTTFSFQVQSSLSNTDLGLGGGLATATITVNPVADTPSVTNATTDVNIQTTSGLVISRNAVDSTEVSHFKITNITNGTLFKNDGITPIANNEFITFAEGNLGLRFTPANNLSSPASTFSFDVQGATSAVGAGLGTAATATITVNCGGTVVSNSNDGGAGSLRAIILSACPGSTITFDMTPGHVTSPITLTSGQLVIDKSLTIQGPGANLLTISGNNTFRLIDASAAGVNLSISGLSFTGGGVQGGAAASVIEFNNAGTLTLTNCEVFANSGAAAVSVVSASQSTGVTVDGSTFRNNTANHSLKADRTPLRVVNSTFSGNTGAGILNASAGSTVTNSTIANNQTGIQSDSLLCSGCAASVTVTNTLFSSNGSLNLLRAGTGTITSGGHNLIDDSTAAAFSAPDASNLIIPAGTARIAPLANNGGPTQTHALLAGSPALDAGDNAAVINPPFTGAAPFNDQRGAGFARIVDGPDADTTATVDIGAFESLLSVEDITDKATNEDTQLQFVFNVGGAASITSVTATSANTTLVPNNAANIAVTGSGSTRTLTINPAANEFGTSLITVTVNGAGGQSMTDTFVLTVNSVNDVPSFIKGADQTVNEDAGAQSVTNWATNLSVGPANEAGQTLSFLVTGNTNPGLFSVAPAISPTGTLTYTPATNVNGSAIITIVIKDNGGTAFGGVDTSASQTFTITVNSVNDAPSFTKGLDQTVNEDAGAQSVAWATNISAGPANESDQTLTFQVTGNTNPGLFSVAPAISPTGTLTYTPAANANGTAGLTIVLKDNGGTALGGVDTSTPQNLVITVNAVNDAPVNSVPGAQNATLNATLVFSAANANLISISDVDAGSDPVQVTLKSTDGTLTLSTTSGLSFIAGDGTDDPLMSFTGSIANINAALNGMGNLAFGTGVIEITTNDLGRNGAGGALSDTDTIQVTVIDNLAPTLLTAAGTDRAIALDSVTMVRDPFALLGDHNFSADHRTRITLFALHAQLKPGETASAITAEADINGTIVPLTVESVRTVPGFDWLTQVVVAFPADFSTGGGGSVDAKVRIRLRGANSNQAVITIVPDP